MVGTSPQATLRHKLLTILGWSRPLSTSISPHTLASFPLTFFFAMTFSATSFVTSSFAWRLCNTAAALEGDGDLGRDCEADGESMDSGDGADERGGRCDEIEDTPDAIEGVDVEVWFPPPSVAVRAARDNWPGGTCQVALCPQKSIQFNNCAGVRHTITFPNDPVPSTS
jgi:hypothetical protein